ncbi:MAG: GAF domain-containing protein, partial [Kangiellaceae bacterium]|nr:GAF domain-containing protein [Kangiellaceae bacterium]
MSKSSGKKSNTITQSASLESALFQITECAVSSRSIKEYCRRLHEIIKQLTYAENFFVALYEQNKSQVNFIYVKDEYDDGVDTEVLSKLTSSELRRTLTGYMLRTGEMQHLSNEMVNLLQSKNVVDSVGKDSHDWLGIPLEYNSEILGGLVIQSYREDIEYGQQEEEILQFVARQIALVFKSKQAELALIDANADLEKRVSERTQELYLANSALTAEVQERKRSQQVQAALFQITELVSTADSLQGLFYGVHQIIKRLMFAENEYIALLSEKRDLIEFPYYVDEVEPHPTNRKYGDAQVKKGFTEKVLISGESLLFCKGQSIQGFEGNTKCESWLGV